MPSSIRPEVPDSDPAADEVVLADDPHRRVVRIGKTIRRPLEPWSASVHALLDHLSGKDFPAPEFLGVDDQGRETLTAIDGVSGPDGWAQVVPEDGLRATARLLRRYHDAVADFHFEPLPWAGVEGPSAADAILCHGDFGPWNLVWRDGEPVGVIDWDYAWPQTALHDVCYALEYVTPFRDDAEYLRWLRYPERPDRRRRIAIFADAYGLPSTPGLVDELIDGVIAQQKLVADRSRRLGKQGHQPQVDWFRDGYADTLASRIASSEAHRATW